MRRRRSFAILSAVAFVVALTLPLGRWPARAEPEGEGTPAAVVPTPAPSTILVTRPRPARVPGVLYNASFTEMDDGAPIGWTSFGSQPLVEPDGERSVVRVSAGGAGVGWLAQTVRIQGGSAFEVRARTDGAVRVSWHATDDGSGDMLGFAEARPLASGVTLVGAGPFVTPSAARSLRVRLVAEGAPGTSAVFSDIALTPVAAPPQPVADAAEEGRPAAVAAPRPAPVARAIAARPQPARAPARPVASRPAPLAEPPSEPPPVALYGAPAPPSRTNGTAVALWSAAIAAPIATLLTVVALRVMRPLRRRRKDADGPLFGEPDPPAGEAGLPARVAAPPVVEAAAWYAIGNGDRPYRGGGHASSGRTLAAPNEHRPDAREASAVLALSVTLLLSGGVAALLRNRHE